MTTYPLASICLVSYNQEKYIEQALDGAFKQTYPNLEIIISDDCSSDNTFKIIKKKIDSYQGPHKVIVNRNEYNLGPRENFNKVLYELSHGEFLFIAAGDDICEENRVSYCIEIMTKHPEVTSLSCASCPINETGEKIAAPPEDTLNSGTYSIFTLADYCHLNLLIFSGDSRVLRREVINKFPPLRYSFSEDIFLFIRSLYLGEIAFIREPLSLYRQHDSSIMGQHRSSQNKRRKVSKEELKHFYDTTARQLREDLKYALKKGYIDTIYFSYIENKIEWVIEILKPQDPSLQYNSFILRCFRKTRKITNHLFEIIERNLQWTNQR